MRQKFEYHCDRNAGGACKQQEVGRFEPATSASYMHVATKPVGHAHSRPNEHQGSAMSDKFE